MKVGIIGAGRIGKVHAKNIAMFVPEMEIKTIADPFMDEEIEAFAKRYGIPNTAKDAGAIINDPEIEAVIICSSTNTHAQYIIEAAKPKTAVVLKEVVVDEKEVFKMVIRLATSKDNSSYKNSIITFMKIDEKEWNRLLRNKKVLYKRE